MTVMAHATRSRRTATDRVVLAAFYDRLAEHRPFQGALRRLFSRLDALAPVPQAFPISQQRDQQCETEDKTVDPFAAALAAPPSSQPAPWQIIEAVDRTPRAREAVSAFCARWRLPANAEEDLLWTYAHRDLVGVRLVVPPASGRSPANVAVPVRTLTRPDREATRTTRRLRQGLLASLGREPIPPRLSRATIETIADRLFTRIILCRSWAAADRVGGGSREQRKDRTRKVVQRWERRLWSGRTGHI
jgi:hypothetical protein